MPHPPQRTLFRRLPAVAALAAPMALAGCGVTLNTPPSTFQHTLTLEGQVFAGRNYMAGATVKLYITQPTGTASNGTYTGSAKLLATKTASNTGAWSIDGFTCSSPDQLYVTAEAGVPYPSGFSVTTLKNNPNSLMMTAIGDCAQLNKQATNNNVTTVITNEATTVAAVWALRPFISLNGTTVNITSSASNYAGTSGTGVVGNYAGLAHAFLNANSINPYNIGNFVQYTNGSNTAVGGGLVPVQELNSLAYAQYLCTIGGDGSTPGDTTYCKTLYGLTTPPMTGASAPTNSLQAMLNIATYPANNAAGIMTFTQTPIPGTSQAGHQQINAGVYVPALTSFGTLTSDWSVAIYYVNGNAPSATGQGLSEPQNIAIDANDDVFISNPSYQVTAGNVVAMTSNGVPLWASATDAKNLTSPRGIAADANGNVWVVNNGTTAATSLVQQLSASSGAVLNTYTSTATSLFGIAVDPVGNVWYSANASTGQNLHELARSGTSYTEATFAVPPSSTYQLLQIRPDAQNNIWVAGYLSTGGAAIVLPNTGTASAPAFAVPLVTAPIGGASSTYGITTDAAGNAYAVANGTGTASAVFKITPTGRGASLQLNATNVATNPAAGSRYMDTDGAGNVWYVDGGTGTPIYKYTPATPATPQGFYPCYNAGTTTGTDTATASSQTCSTGFSTRTDFAIDSTGSVWVVSYGSSALARVGVVLGLAAPTIPLHSLAKPGVMP